MALFLAASCSARSPLNSEFVSPRSPIASPIADKPSPSVFRELALTLPSWPAQSSSSQMLVDAGVGLVLPQRRSSASRRADFQPSRGPQYVAHDAVGVDVLGALAVMQRHRGWILPLPRHPVAVGARMWRACSRDRPCTSRSRSAVRRHRRRRSTLPMRGLSFGRRQHRAKGFDVLFLAPFVRGLPGTGT